MTAGGNKSSLYSLDNGVSAGGSSPTDLLVQDTARAEATSGDYSFNGAHIWITSDGKVGYDATTLSAAFKAQLNSLSKDEVLSDTFTYAIKLTDGTLSWSMVTVQFAGLNDIVTISSAPQSLNVSEDATPLVAGGSILFTDADLGDVHTANFSSKPGNNDKAYGAFSLDPVSQAAGFTNGSVQWHYVFDNAKVQSLAEGQVITETYKVTITDGRGSTATQDVTITITGKKRPGCYY